MPMSHTQGTLKSGPGSRWEPPTLSGGVVKRWGHSWLEWKKVDWPVRGKGQTSAVLSGGSLPGARQKPELSQKTPLNIGAKYLSVK